MLSETHNRPLKFFSSFKLISIIIIILLMGIIFAPSAEIFIVNDISFEDPQNSINGDILVESDTGNSESIAQKLFDGKFEPGYELIIPTSEVLKVDQPRENDHLNGIPPISDRYKNPIYTSSSTRSGPTVINETVLLILVNFTGNTTTRPAIELEDAVFNKTAGGISVHNYYKEVSYGAVNIDAGVLNGAAGGNWLQIPQNKSYYGKDKTSGGYVTDDGDNGSGVDGLWTTVGKVEMVRDACAAANAAGVDFGKYDNNGPDGVPNSTDDDGIVDHILIIFSGNGQNHYGRDTTQNSGPDDDGGANDYGRDLIWPSRLSFNFGQYDGKNVFGATVNPEDPDFNVPVGVICHEFGHDLGLPDLYDIDGSTNAVVGDWELMDAGTYNTNVTGAARPAHPGAWCKEQLGWIQPIIINETNNNQGVHQVNQTASPTNESVCFKIKIEGENEYYLIENRNKTVGTYDEGLPDRGILIWHIDDDMNPQGSNRGPPTYSYYPILLENYQNNADAENYITNMNLACWKSSGFSDQKDFNTTTTPNSSANGGTPSGIHIDRVKDNALWNMTVRILVTDDIKPPAPPQDVLVFDAPYDNGGAINLTWNASVDDVGGDNDVIFYNIYMNDTGGISAPKVLINSLVATKSINYQYQVTGLSNHVLYNFTILADDGPNVSPWPGNFTAAPLDNIVEPPTGVAAVDTFPDDGGNITVTWTLSIDDPLSASPGADDLIMYNISMNDTGQGSGGSKHVIVSLGPGNTTYRVQNLTNNVSYYFIITSVDGEYNDGHSNEVTAIPLDTYIGSPKNLGVTPSGWSNAINFTFDWENPIDNSGIIGAFYKLNSVPNNDNDYTNFIAGSGLTTLNISGPFSDGTHPVFIWLKDDENNSNYLTAASANILYDGTPPDSPIGLTTSAGSWSDSDSFTISWTNPVEVSGITRAYYSLNKSPTNDTDGTYQVGININQLNNIIVPSQGIHTLYVWLSDSANNIDYTTNDTIILRYDPNAPGAPLDIKVDPESWTNSNSFSISWTNPNDLSGIVGARYTLNNQPFFKNDGTFISGIHLTSISNIRVSYSGVHTLYLWLVDNATNVDHLNYNTTKLYFDNHLPYTPFNIQTIPMSWTNDNAFVINWTNQWDHSGISGAYYKLDSPPTGNFDGIYTPGIDIHELVNISVSSNGTHELYLWVSDLAGNVDYLNNTITRLYYDALAPEAPINITPSPNNVWTNNNNFSIKWKNPQEHSGIAGVYYKLNSPPLSNTDGTFIKKNYIQFIDEIQAPQLGENLIYVWLVDRVGNIDFNNYGTTKLLFDDIPPSAPMGLSITPLAWTKTNNFQVTWSNPYDHSGIMGVQYHIKSSSMEVWDYVLEDNISSIDNLKLPGNPPPSDEHIIYIWLIDYAYNVKETNNVSGALRFDVQPPTIRHTNVYYATQNLPLTISASITDSDSGLDKIKLYYKHESDESYKEQEMVDTGGDVYKSTIPGTFVTSEKIGYFLYASDYSHDTNIRYYAQEGQVSSLPGPESDIDITITESDLIPPMIIHEKVETGTVGQKLALTASVMDDGSGVKEVKVFYRTKNAKNFQESKMLYGNPYYFELSEQVMNSLDGVYYYLYAIDNSPRENAIYFGNYGLSTVQPRTNDSYISISLNTEDDSAPVIKYGPEVTKITSTTATIFWITDEPADSGVDYGIVNDNLDIHGFNNSYFTYHSLVITGLTQDTKYYYKISSSDIKGNGPTYSKIKTFKTTTLGSEDNDGDGVSDSEDLDDDDDGMPDAWEEYYGLDPKNPLDADFDPDGDGYSNLLESILGSDPLDKKSSPNTLIDATPPSISHSPKTVAYQLETFVITAKVTDNGSGVQNVTLHYKSKSAQEYESIQMYLSESGVDLYSYQLPRETISIGDFEYYLEAADWATEPNIIFYGKDGLIGTRPTAENDIDVDVREKSSSSDGDDANDGDFFENIGEPFGVTDAGLCLLIIIILIVLLVCFILAVRSAYHARSIANKSTRYKSETSEGRTMFWEGEDIEEVDEAEDLTALGSEDEEKNLEGL